MEFATGSTSPWRYPVKGTFTPTMFGLDFLTFQFSPNQNNRCERFLEPRPGNNEAKFSLTRRGHLGPDRTEPMFDRS